MTKLFRDLMPQQGSNTGGTGNEFIDHASRQGFRAIVQDFIRFFKMAQGKDMGAIVQELRQSGAMDEATFADLKNKAQGFMQLIKMFLK